MTVLRESPWYNEILKEGTDLGIQQGIQQGIEQGIRQGIEQEVLESIELGLELKFGNEGLQLLPEITEIRNLETLKKIRTALRNFQSIKELRQTYLPQGE